MIWTVMFSGDAYGYANSLLMYLGIIQEPIQWLTDPTYMLGLVFVVMLWMSLGAGFLSFVAGLQTVDKTYYEVGYMEGDSQPLAGTVVRYLASYETPIDVWRGDVHYRFLCSRGCNDRFVRIPQHRLCGAYGGQSFGGFWNNPF